MAYAIDEKRRCAIYAAAYATHEIAAHLISVLARLKSIPYGCFGKPKLCADQEDRSNAQPALVFEQGIVHIPEQSRRAGELRAFGRDLGVRVYFGQREMPVNEPHASAKGQ